ncbi:apolipoprotein L2-like [Salvelinus sp. IW2-2015]|uniref:apolipoprotein L2-like n=1 Tax=Salvelinus sp. IW2-2015 TaxID=2691554 RepID=UPI000CDF9A12|nr:apolipoprotein L2-like [Salvelinus alpinus]XP_023837681.1 apolipoprotein L2-like [Salvelinus alpinus]
MENNQSAHESGSSDDSMESPPEMRLKKVKKELKESVEVFRHLLDESLMDLQAKVKELHQIADSYENWHRATTRGSLVGGIIGATGGITTLVGLALAPFTLGTSMVVAGVGMGIGVTGGITGAASNITSIVSQRSDRQNIQNIQKHFLEKVKPIEESWRKINWKCEELIAMVNDTVVTGIGLYKIAANLSCLDDFVSFAKFANISKLSPSSAKYLRSAAALTGVLSGLLLVIDIISIVIDFKELDAMENGNQIQSDTVRFIQRIRDMAEQYEQTLNMFTTAKKEILRNKFD